MALALVLLWLATYRATRLIVADAFPPAAAARQAVADRFGDASSWAYLVTCPWCAGVYVALAATWAWDAHVYPLTAPWAVAATVAALAGLTADASNAVDELTDTLRGAQRALPIDPEE